MLMRILLLLSIAWIIRLTAPFFTVLGRGISGRDLILIGGGLFLLAKATMEIHDRLEGEEEHGSARVVAAGPISGFVNRHPTVKVLALSFLLLIGVSLIGDGLGVHAPKGYIYFAMGFSVFVEMINLRVRGVGPAVKLHQRFPGKEV
jgi:predicted tellurium resistance membrane protein TerC